VQQGTPPGCISYRARKLRQKTVNCGRDFYARISTGVPNQDQHDITAVLAAWNAGDAGALDRLMDLVYPELRRIARQHLDRRRSGETLESAALANEAYLKLVRAGGIRCDNRTHFLALCSQIIRRILVDHARRRGFAKRGGGALRVPLDEVLLAAEVRGIEVLALDQALHSLAGIDGRKSRVVELRYFGGLSIEETAEVLGVSVDTAKRDWRMARAWLIGELTGRRDPASS
jgi:RNA polymerase sigma factor (TIGR02999 family)